MKKISSIVALLLAFLMLLFVSCDKDTPPDTDNTDPTPAPVTWTVTFHPNNGEADTTQTVTDGRTVMQPNAPTRKDYGFAGWYREDTLTTPWNFASDIVLANTDLYAKWEDQRSSVLFDSCGGTDVYPVKYETGAPIAAPDAPVRNGYAFDGWYTADGKAWNFDDPVSEGLTLMAHWRELDLAVTDETPLDLAAGTYTGVRYDGNWIDGMNDVAALSEISMQFTYTAAVPGDYGLYMAAAKEWNDAKHAYFRVEVNGVALEDHLILAPTGSWSDALNSNVIRVPFRAGANTVRVTVDTALVEDKLDAVEKIKGVYVLNVYPHDTYLPKENSGATLYREDITTEAPYTDNAYLLTDTAQTLTFRMTVRESGNYDLFLYAARPTSAGTMPLWVSLNGADTYETLWISQLADQGSRENTFRRQTSVSVHLTAGENTVTLCIPEGVKIDETAFLKVMYAVVAKSENQGEKVLVTFDPANGQTMRPASVTIGNCLVPPVQPTSETGSFAGWYLGEEAWNFADPVTGAMTLTAHYTSRHTVTFAGTPQVESVSVLHGGKVDKDALRHTANPGYQLAFWTDAGMTVPFDFETVINADTTIYVSWAKIENATVTVTPLGISEGTFDVISWDGSKIDWGQANGSVTVHFTAETAGEYNIFLKYARDISWGSYQCAEYVITVNGTPVTEYLRIVPTDGWGTTVNTNAVRVTLQAGDNEIKISTRNNSDTSSFIAHIYEAYLTSPATDSAQLPAQIQAASGTLHDCNSQYGGKFVDFDRAGSYVEITVDVAAEGDYDLSLLYAANMAAGKVVEIYLNGADTAAGMITVAAGSSRDQYGYSDNATVHLVAGSNTIRIVLTEASEGNFDLSAIRISAQ